MIEVSSLLIGLLLGFKHAFEPDHIATVSTLSHNSRKYIITGALWSAGHNLMIIFAMLLLNSAGIDLSKILPFSWEMLVGISMIILGISSLSRFHIHPHFHNNKLHIHRHKEGHHPSYEHKPLVFGMIHGLAGSGALLLLFTPDILFSFTAGVTAGMLSIMFTLSIFSKRIFKRINFEIIRTLLTGISIGIGIMLITSVL